VLRDTNEYLATLPVTKLRPEEGQPATQQPNGASFGELASDNDFEDVLLD